MIFSSPTFLFLFLPAVLTFYYLVGANVLRNIFLLVASLFFYAWGEGIYLLVMLASIMVNYSAGILLGQSRLEQYKRIILSFGVTLNLLLLGVFKYTNFVVELINDLFSAVSISEIDIAAVHLPIGISFFTFQAISYLVDIYRGQAEVQKNPLDCGLYIALFPQLIAGPIVRYQWLANQLHGRTHTIDKMYRGILIFIVGLAKKMLIANPMGEVADQIFAIPGDELTTLLAWSGVLAYSLQIYFDFSGYSDMAIGLGRMFGFEFNINFNYPYIAKSFREFWRRWHISLSTWFRDYLYLPLGGNRGGMWKTGRNLLLVFFLCGLWHGASWNFVIWGMLHGIFLVFERSKAGIFLGRQNRIIGHLYLIVGVMTTWVFFRLETMPEALAYLQAMYWFQPETFVHPLNFYWNTYTITICSIGLIAATPIAPAINKKFLTLPVHRYGNIAICLFQSTACCLLLYLCAMELAAGTYNPFIYFRF